jgi:prepilin-type N-terminal cleavage/methylation domain-containing protein
MNIHSKQKGFTLIEMIVSLAIFTVVALVAVGALVKIMDANRKSLTLKSSINNLNFALESISREIRMGHSYYCMQDLLDIDVAALTQHQSCQKISDGDWTLAFKSSKRSSDNQCNLVFAYRFKDNTFEKAEATDCIGTIVNGEGSNSDFFPLISPDVTISKASITVENNKQPRIFLYIDGSTGVRERDKTAFSIQTTISQRLPN